jgi:hypothetical protein
MKNTIIFYTEEIIKLVTYEIYLFLQFQLHEFNNILLYKYFPLLHINVRLIRK